MCPERRESSDQKSTSLKIVPSISVQKQSGGFNHDKNTCASIAVGRVSQGHSETQRPTTRRNSTARRRSSHQQRRGHGKNGYTCRPSATAPRSLSDSDCAHACVLESGSAGIATTSRSDSRRHNQHFSQFGVSRPQKQWLEVQRGNECGKSNVGNRKLNRAIQNDGRRSYSFVARCFRRVPFDIARPEAVSLNAQRAKLGDI